MIEILVALVILAIGLLGMATLMINSLQTSQSAAMRSVATQAAYDLIERMRANADEEVLKNKSYETGGLVKAFLGHVGSCSGMKPRDLAECELKTWYKALDPDKDPPLPGAQVVVKAENPVGTPPQNRLWCIGIFWKDTGGKSVTAGSDTACGVKPSDSGPWAFYQVKVLL